ncbi:phosphatase PAP2 family protein [Effusibacillus lacus]|uniref:Phosphoesterase PA-phosphatase related n=1 Tax=Effusibacillus lacus TaxID=1348429 RepID=A0A292YID5_9BACL|nr:phosphatase PAP2 family protein [Effusibacillus lacus]TCS69783.1 undecaprenyl-diphosphatase [Effusibacillus lacus]GAX88866.1 Phosphoesterase PA-phosphatase related [Effusibacillus lacus]
MQKMTDWVRGGDITTFFWVNHSLRSSLLDKIMPCITHFGGAVWSILLALALLLFGNSFLMKTGVHMALSLLISHLVVSVCKKVYPRRRPYQALEDVCTGRKLLCDASFPSGHSTAAFSMATVLTIAFPAFTAVFYGVAVLVALSRVYLGLHYPTDIAIGAMLGTVTALVIA